MSRYKMSANLLRVCLQQVLQERIPKACKKLPRQIPRFLKDLIRLANSIVPGDAASTSRFFHFPQAILLEGFIGFQRVFQAVGRPDCGMQAVEDQSGRLLRVD